MKLFKRPSPGLIVAALALFVALGGAGMAATGGTLILGDASTADKTTALAVSTLPDATACPAPCPALKVTNNSTAAHTGGLSVLNKSSSTPAATLQNSGGTSALKLLVSPGKAPFTVNSGGKVANLNADTVDGKDATAFMPADGKAADADKLDGIDSRGLVQGSGNTYALAVSIPRSTVFAYTLYSPYPVVAPEFFNVSLSCPGASSSDSPQLRFDNLTSADENLFLRNDSYAGARWDVVPPGGSLWRTTEPTGDLTTATIQGLPGAQTVASLQISTVLRSSDCHFQIQALITQQ